MYTIKNAGREIVIVKVQWVRGWGFCTDPWEYTIGAGQSVTHGSNAGYCAPYVAMYDREITSLFNGKELVGWKYFPENAAKTYSVEDGYVKVNGPEGYFYTDKSYKNYLLKFEWRYKRPANLEDETKFHGNSGLLLHISGPHRVWPHCLEIQGMNRDYGLYLNNGRTGLRNFKFNRDALEKARNRIGEWNTTEVSVNNGEVAVKINGVTISSGHIDLVEGPFGFQSEGAEVHYRNIGIKILS